MSSRAGRLAHLTVEENAAIMNMHFRRKTTARRIEILAGESQNACKCTKNADHFVREFRRLTKVLRFIFVAASHACRFL
jgi:hypothetical protein